MGTYYSSVWHTCKALLWHSVLHFCPTYVLNRGYIRFRCQGSHHITSNITETLTQQLLSAQDMVQTTLQSGVIDKDRSTAGPSQSTLVSIEEHFPALSKRLFDKIVANEYTDFMDHVPLARGKMRSLPHHLDSQLLLVQLQDVEDFKKIIMDFSDIIIWIQCFTIYASAYNNPNVLPNS